MTRSPELQLQPDISRYTLARFLDDVAQRHAGRVAISGESSEITFEDLRKRARALAKGLVASGVVKGARVAVLLGSRPEWAVAYFGVGLVGAVVVPVNTFAKPQELDHILRHSDASTLILQTKVAGNHFLADLMSRHPSVAEGTAGQLACEALPHLRRVFAFDPGAFDPDGTTESSQPGIGAWQDLFASEGAVSDALLDAMSEQIEPSDDAMIVYTSGTTALPKGVVHLQRAPVIQAWRFAEHMGLTSDDVVYSTYPFFWTAGIAMALGGSLASGARLVVDEIFDPGRALSRIESERATAVQAWPHQEKAMADHPSAGERDLSSVTKVEFARSIAKLVGLEKDEWGTHGSYGMSETFTICSSVPATADAIIREETSGLPLPGMTLRIVDPETGARLPDHEKGEIAVKGLTLMRGYHKVDPERVFDEDGFFHSQDAGSFDAEGYLRWSGRLSNLIKTGGANVSPLEIEGVLAEREDLRVAMAVGIPHPTLGEIVVLCAVPAAGQHPTEDEIRKFLRGRLAAYKIPKRVLFFEAGDLSLTANQKIQVDPLRKAAQQRLEQEHAEIDGATYTPPDP